MVVRLFLALLLFSPLVSLISLNLPNDLKYSPVLKDARALEKKITKYRRDLHLIPELAFDLPKTSAYVKK